MQWIFSSAFAVTKLIYRFTNQQSPLPQEEPHLAFKILTDLLALPDTFWGGCQVHNTSLSLGRFSTIQEPIWESHNSVSLALDKQLLKKVL